MKQRILSWLLLFAANVAGAWAQKMEAPHFSGYLKNSTLLASTRPDLLEENLWQNIIYQRLNVDWRLHPSLRVEAGVRNQLYTGNATLLSYIEENIDKDGGWANCSWNVFSRDNMLYHLNIDRLSLRWAHHAWEVKIGRQRINWGQTLGWNPNNIFNPYLFFQFNYSEIPGCDAIRTTYYHSPTSYTEFAASLNRRGKLTAALLHNHQAEGATSQFMGGIYRGEDAVVGGALTTTWGGCNLRMEGTYFHPVVHGEERDELLQVSAGADYIFSNNLAVQGEVFYQSRSVNTELWNLFDFYADPQSVRELSVSRWSVLAQVAYPFNSRFSARLSGAYFADKQFSYARLYLNYRLSRNLEASLFAHYFNYAHEEPIRLRAQLGVLQCKWNF